MSPLPDRRKFLQAGLASGLGLGVAWSPFGPSYLAGVPAPKADAVLHIFVAGGLSHIDTFDPKPYAPVEIRGEFKTVKSKANGEPLSVLLRRTAAIADRLVVIRSLTHGEAAHERGTHNMLTGYRPSPAITYPSMGSVVAHELGGRKGLPPYVCVPSANEPFLGTGYLSSGFAPFSVGGEPRRGNFAVRDLSTPKGLGPERVSRRRRLLEMIDEDFAPAKHNDAVKSLEAFYEQAYELIDTPQAREAFNIKKEPKKVRDRYGMTNVGQRLLLARRLVEAGVRYITVMDTGYDHHQRLGPTLKIRMRAFDRGFATLIKELSDKGLLDKTLVVVSTEFGRTPRMNRDGGRDHWPKVFSIALAGGGLKRGLIHGASDTTGSEPANDPVSPADLAATVFHLAGIDPTKRLLSPGDRPIDIVRDGRVLKELIA